MIRSMLIVFTIAAGVLASGTRLSSAQSTPRLSELLPQVDTAAAVNSLYGVALINEFAKAIHADADASCLQSRGLDSAALKKAARDLLLLYGPNVQRIMTGVLDSEEFAIELAKEVPPISMDELRRLLTDPVMQRRATLLIPELMEELLDRIITQIKYASIIQRLLKTKLGKYEEGQEELIKVSAKRMVDEENDLAKFDDANPSPLAKRFDEVWPKLLLVQLKSSIKGKWANLSFKDYIPDLSREFSKLCIGKQ